MQTIIKEAVSPKFKSYLISLRKKISHEENREQVIYLYRKVINAISIAKVYAKKEGLSKDEFTVTQVYILLFYFRMVNIFEASLAENKEGDKVVTVKKLVDENEIYNDFNLSVKDQSQLSKALSDFSVPVARHYSMAIKIGHDAVASIFGKKKFVDNLNEYIDEFEFYFATSVGNFERYTEVLDYLTKTRYYSNAATEKRLARKIQNKNKLIKFIQQQKAASSITNNKRAMTMVKTSSRNQIDLLSIADKKAGIMITVNSILLTILIPLFASYIFNFSSYIIPIIILVVTCAITIIFATLATRPSANPDAKDSEEKLNSGETSIFYFKNFARLSKDEFVEGANVLLNKDVAFEKAVFTDLYDVGIDLDRKYRSLRWCYTVFATGIVLTMISFIFSVIYFSAT